MHETAQWSEEPPTCQGAVLLCSSFYTPAFQRFVMTFRAVAFNIIENGFSQTQRFSKLNFCEMMRLLSKTKLIGVWGFFLHRMLRHLM